MGWGGGRSVETQARVKDRSPQCRRFILASESAERRRFKKQLSLYERDLKVWAPRQAPPGPINRSGIREYTLKLCQHNTSLTSTQYVLANLMWSIEIRNICRRYMPALLQ